LLLYYITDRTQFAGSDAHRREQLLARIAEAARAGVDYIQLREKDLSSRELEGLALAAVDAVRETGSKTRLLINSRTDVSLVVGADGVHLRSRDISPSDVRRIYRSAGLTTEPVVAVSCHSDGQIEAAKAYGMSPFLLFRRITLPSMLPYAIPGLSNLWLNATKDSALISVVGYLELTKITQQAAGGTKWYITFYCAAALIYLIISLASLQGFGILDRYVRRGQPKVR